MNTPNGISARVIADSTNPAGARITTMIATYPRFIHAEHLRHRAFSFSVASSRAIPTAKFREMVDENPAIPVWWGKNQSGMAAKSEVEDPDLCWELWNQAMDCAIARHAALERRNLHKQICNRLLETFEYLTVLVTGTDWANFFAQRCHPDAQPEMQAAADAMLEAYCESTPAPKEHGQWHIPFGDKMEPGLSESDQLEISAARCARLSYLTFDGDHSVEKDLELTGKLRNKNHWSPFEHQAVAVQGAQHHIANYRGWASRRFLLGYSTVPDAGFDFAGLLAKRRAGA